MVFFFKYHSITYKFHIIKSFIFICQNIEYISRNKSLHIHLIVNNHRIPYHCIKLLKMCMEWLFMYLEYYRYIRANEIRKKSFNVRSKSLPYMILCNKTKNEKEETSQYTFLTVSTSSWNTRRCVWWILFFYNFYLY